MKKTLCLIVLFLIAGCSSKNIMVDKIVAATYNEQTIVENDYESITTILNQLKFSCGKQQNYVGNTLTITTNDQIYQFHISSNYYMEFKENDKYCYTKETEKIKKLMEILEQIITKYTDITFFTIYNQMEDIIDDNNLIIKLDKQKNYIVINSLYPLTNFKINEIEYQEDGNYKEIDLLYSINSVDANKTIVIRKEILQKPNFKISFYSPYNYLINILPISSKNNEINFITNINKNS